MECLYLLLLDGVLGKEEFKLAFRPFILTEGVGTPTGHERTRRDTLVMRLFDIFDSDHNGSVDMVEMIAGISILCGGSGK